MYSKFISKFQIPQEDYVTPGRDWDDEGLASWYVEKIEAPLTDERLIGLMLIANCYDGTGITGDTRQILEDNVIMKLINLLDNDNSGIIKQKVLDLYKDTAEDADVYFS